MDKYSARECKIILKEILLHDWDPIGISEFPDAYDEYDSYLGLIFFAIHEGATEQDIANQLSEIESNQMGLPKRKGDDLIPVASKLIRSYEDFVKDDAT